MSLLPSVSPATIVGSVWPLSVDAINGEIPTVAVSKGPAEKRFKGEPFWAYLDAGPAISMVIAMGRVGASGEHPSPDISNTWHQIAVTRSAANRELIIRHRSIIAPSEAGYEPKAGGEEMGGESDGMDMGEGSDMGGEGA